MAQFCVSTGQVNIDNLPTPLLKMTQQLSFSMGSFYVWKRAKHESAARGTTTKRRLAGLNNTMIGMERYAAAVGIAPNYLLYVTLAGLASAFGLILILLACILVCGHFCTKHYAAFRRNMVDRAIGCVVGRACSTSNAHMMSCVMPMYV